MDHMNEIVNADDVSKQTKPNDSTPLPVMNPLLLMFFTALWRSIATIPRELIFNNPKNITLQTPTQHSDGDNVLGW